MFFFLWHNPILWWQQPLASSSQPDESMILAQRKPDLSTAVTAHAINTRIKPSVTSATDILPLCDSKVVPFSYICSSSSHVTQFDFFCLMNRPNSCSRNRPKVKTTKCWWSSTKTTSRSQSQSRLAGKEKGQNNNNNNKTKCLHTELWYWNRFQELRNVRNPPIFKLGSSERTNAPSDVG